MKIYYVNSKKVEKYIMTGVGDVGDKTITQMRGDSRNRISKFS